MYLSTLSSGYATFLLMISLCLSSYEAKTSEEDLRYFLNNVTSLTADFNQHVVDETGFTLERSAGKLYLSRPGRFRWDYLGADEFSENATEQPIILQQQIIADGDSLFLYDPELEQATKRNLLTAIGQVPSLLLVQANSDIDRHFEVSDFGITDGLSWVALKPKQVDASYQQLLLGFNQKLLSSIILLDGLGNETRLTLTDVENNTPINHRLFVFELPEGVDLLSE